MSNHPILPVQEVALDLTASDVAEQFQPYAIELGAFVYGWNQLHDDLGGLFWSILGGANGAVPLAIWHSTTSDRTQREMLRAASDAKFWVAEKPIDEKAATKKREAASLIKWLLDQADKLSRYRNDVIHAPYWFLKGEKKLIPNTFQGNLRAAGLKDKDLLTEFRWCRATASSLSNFTNRMILAINNFRDEQPPWPDIPPMPPRGDQSAPKSHRQEPRPRKPKPRNQHRPSRS